FVRTALRGLRIPQHHDDFWDVLHAELDLAEADLAAQPAWVEPEVPPVAAAPVLPEAAAAPTYDEPAPGAEAVPPGPEPEPEPELGGQIEWNPAAAPVERVHRPAPADVARPRRRAPLRAVPTPAERKRPARP